MRLKCQAIKGREAVRRDDGRARGGGADDAANLGNLANLGRLMSGDLRLARFSVSPDSRAHRGVLSAATGAAPPRPAAFAPLARSDARRGPISGAMPHPRARRSRTLRANREPAMDRRTPTRCAGCARKRRQWRHGSFFDSTSKLGRSNKT